MLISFLGSIGKFMVSYGLEEVFEEIYSEDTVRHIFWISCCKGIMDTYADTKYID